jgi:hypothetical protein
MRPSRGNDGVLDGWVVDPSAWSATESLVPSRATRSLNIGPVSLSLVRKCINGKMDAYGFSSRTVSVGRSVRDVECLVQVLGCVTGFVYPRIENYI